MLALLLTFAACRVPGPGTDDTAGGGGGGGRDSADTAACTAGADADHDGWIAAADGGHDCDDDDTAVGDCTPADTGDEPCTPTGPETCNGVDDDCDGYVDDRYAAVVDAPAKVVAGGHLLAGGAAAVVVGQASDAPGADGAVSIYAMDGSLVVRIAGTGQSPSFGSQLAAGRDLTGDGVEDLVIAAPFCTTDDGPNSGRVFVFAGPITAATTLADAVGNFEGGELDGQPGGQLAVIPDLDGDGLPELVLGYYRHVLGFSGAPKPGARRADAIFDLEVNTGGGPWHFASLPDRDGDGRPELLLGMETYAGGAGLLAEVDSTAPTKLGPTWADAAWPGLGSKLVVVDGVPWTLSGTTPVRADTWTSLSLSATNLANGGDLDGDGHDDLLVETAAGVVAPGLGGPTVVGSLQGDRNAGPPDDLTGDGVDDPRLVVDGVAAILDGATGFADPCDGDGDGTSAAAGDCDDADPTQHPAAHETCDGLDGDCDGLVDAPAEAALALPRGVDAYGVALADADASGLVLGIDGVAAGFGSWEGTEVSGLQGVTWGGDSRGLGVADLLGHAAAADVVIAAGAVGAAETAARARLYDGVGLTRTGALGSFGDYDGDGADEVYVAAVDPAGHTSVALLAGPLPEDVALDEADWRIDLPDGWSGVAYAPTRGPGGADLDGDGRDDLLVGSSTAYYGQGRVSVFTTLARGAYEADGNAFVDWYGEPEEALGSALAVGGDVDGDGVADALVAGARGTRVLRGGACPALTQATELPTQWLGLVDLDGDGVAEPVAGADGWLWHGDGPWREASTVWSAGSLGLVFADAEGTWITRPGCE